MEIIKDNAIEIGFEATDWQDAVRKAGNLLERVNLAKHEYTEKMIENVRVFGSYIVMAPGIAMPHADSLCGALGSGISFVKLKNEVIFPSKEDNPVKILIGVVAADKQKHMETFAYVAGKMLDPNVISELKKAEKISDVTDIFNK